ncbi:MAG: ANTAR domain-containing protein, partial [candidate division NC10 bacterium]
KELDALRQEVSDLKEALETRKLVEQAKGVLMKRLQLSEAEAFRRMQQKSRRKRTNLRDVASTILQAEEFLGSFEETP